MIHRHYSKARIMLLLLLHIACLALLSCAGLKPTGRDTRALATLPQYWLTTSMYGGPFYENNEIVLMDYRPFNTIDDALTADGKTIYPPSSDHIIPAGTLVQITKVTYANTKESHSRPLYSPRENIWVHLHVAQERGQVTVFHDKDHILLVPKNITNKEGLKSFLNSLLSKKDPHPWILSERTYIQDGIWQKKPVIGMSKRDVKAALGPPVNVEQHRNDGEEIISELWHYPHYFIIIKNEQVSKVKNLQAKI